MNLTLNNLQVYWLAELLKPHRNSDNRQVRNLVKKMDELVKKQKEQDAETTAFIKAILGEQ